MQDTPETPGTGGTDPAGSPTPPPPPPAATASTTGTAVGPHKGLFDRARDILTKPTAEWPVIAAEGASVGGLITGYALILAAIAPIAMLLGLLLTPMGGFLTSFGSFLIKMLLVIYAVSLGTVLLLGLAINLLAPNLGGTKNSVQAMKLAVYSGTAFWVAALVLIFPSLWMLWLLIGVGYGGYLLWLGLPVLMRVPADKAGVYAGACIGIWVVLFLVLQRIGWQVVFSGFGYGLM